MKKQFFVFMLSVVATGFASGQGQPPMSAAKLCTAGMCMIGASAAGSVSTSARGIAIPAVEDSRSRIDASCEQWESLRNSIAEGPMRCLPQALFVVPKATESELRFAPEFGVYGVGQNFLELRERWSQQTYAAHLALLDSALDRVFHKLSSQRTSESWRALARISTKTNLSFCAVRDAGDAKNGSGARLRCEHYFCVRGCGLCVFFEQTFTNAEDEVIMGESKRQLTLLQTWATEIQNENGGVLYVDQSSHEYMPIPVKEPLLSMPNARLRSSRTGSCGVNGRTRPLAMIFCIVIAIAVFALRFVVRRRRASGDEIDVDRCLMTNRALKCVVTQRMLEEWAIIVRFFSCGSESRKLCVSAVLFLWEKIFEPKMSHAEVHELDERIKSACGFYKVYSKQNFELTAVDVIGKAGREAAWRNWQMLSEYAYSISDRIGGKSEIEMPSGFGESVYGLLKTWDGKFDGIMLLPVDWKDFFRAHPELAEEEFLVRYGVRSAEEKHRRDGRVSDASCRTDQKGPEVGLAFLDAGKDGILRGMFWKEQQKIVLDAVSCRLYLPNGWDAEAEVEMISPHDCVARVAGPEEHEWLSVEHLHLSPEHVHDDLGDWINASRALFGRLHLQPHRRKSQGVTANAEVSFERLNGRDTLFMKYHGADDMAAFVGMIEIEGRLHRLVIVVVRRGADSWKFEYVFPAADGVTKEFQEFRPGEISSALRIFVPIETYGKAVCSICGEKMEEPREESDEGKLEVWMKGFFLFDDMQVPKASMSIPCCTTCREKVRAVGVAKARFENIPAVRDQIIKGASILEVKCGADTVPLLEIRQATEPPRSDVGIVKTDGENGARPSSVDRFAVLKEMQGKSQQLVGQIHEAEKQGLPIDGLVREHISLLVDFRALFAADAEARNLAPLDRISGEIKILGNIKAWSKKIGLPVAGYDKEIFDLRCHIFSPYAVRQLFHDDE